MALECLLLCILATLIDVGTSQVVPNANQLVALRAIYGASLPCYSAASDAEVCLEYLTSQFKLMFRCA
jgi:hypothetical protein